MSLAGWIPFCWWFLRCGQGGKVCPLRHQPHYSHSPSNSGCVGYVTSHVRFRYHLTGGRIRGCKLNVEVQAQQRLSELNLSCGRCPTLRTEMSTAECDWLLHEGVVASAIPELFDQYQYICTYYFVLVRITSAVQVPCSSSGSV